MLKNAAPDRGIMNPDGLCACGCGAKTTISTRNDARNGEVKGMPRKYLKGHHLRKSIAPPTGYQVDTATGCWVWLLCKDKRGYGRVMFDGALRMAHRVEWERVNGPVQHGLELDHLCRNVGCVNPEHLEAVTPTENKRRSLATKLTLANVKEIKRSSESYAELARQFSVNPSTISAIYSGASWKDVKP